MLGELRPLLDQILDLSSPVQILARLRYFEPETVAYLTLAPDYFEYAASHGFKTDRGNLKAITLTSEVLPSSDPFDKENRPQPDPKHIWVNLNSRSVQQRAKRLQSGWTLMLCCS